MPWGRQTPRPNDTSVLTGQPKIIYTSAHIKDASAQ